MMAKVFMGFVRRNRRLFSHSTALAFWLGCGLVSASAQAPYDNLDSAEGWAWSQIKTGHFANFNQRCSTPRLDPRDETDTRWQDRCRTISSQFIEDLLTRSPWRDAIPRPGVTIGGARVMGKIDLENAKLVSPLEIYNSRVEGAITLRRAHTDSLIAIQNTLVTGSVNANSLHSDAELFFRNGTVLQKRASLIGAKIKGQVDMTGASLEGILDADHLEIDGSLMMGSDSTNKASFQEVVLRGAKVKGQVGMIGASLKEKLDADNLQLDGSLIMDSESTNEATFQEVALGSAKIKGTVSMIGASFDGPLTAFGIEIGRDLFMRSEGSNRTHFKNVELQRANIGGDLELVGALLEGRLNAAAVQIGGSLLMERSRSNEASFGKVILRHAAIGAEISLAHARFADDLDGQFMHVGSYFGMADASFAGQVDLKFSRIGSNLDLRGATLAELDLRGASIAADLQLADAAHSVVWTRPDQQPGKLNLRNTRVGNLMDSEKAWPQKGHLSLHGFVFDRFGGIESDLTEMRKRPMKWWDGWVRRDPGYSPVTYAQLATAFGNLGDRDAANDIRYLSHERAREEVCSEWPRNWHTCIVQGALGLVAGYGIGSYSFRVLYWVIGFALAGALLLWFTVPAARANHRGAFWSFGASLSQLLPVIQLNPEFSDFFKDPERERLRGWQIATFSALSIVGWILGGILVLAVSGLTQNP